MIGSRINTIVHINNITVDKTNFIISKPPFVAKIDSKLSEIDTSPKIKTEGQIIVNIINRYIIKLGIENVLKRGTNECVQGANNLSSYQYRHIQFLDF